MSKKTDGNYEDLESFSKQFRDLELPDKFVFYERHAGFADRYIHIKRIISSGKKLGLPIFIYWPINKECTASYTDYFEDIDDVIFVNEQIAEQMRGHPGIIDENILMDMTPRKIIFDKSFTRLKLKSEYIKAVNDYVADNEISNAIGFHVRKTDIRNKEKQRNFTIQYDNFDQVARSSKSNIFIATDDSGVRTEFVKKYGDRILFYREDFDTSQLRQTSLETAIIELFILAHCSVFYGTTRENGKLVSAYSRLASELHKARKNNHLEGFESISLLNSGLFSFLREKTRSLFFSSR